MEPDLHLLAIDPGKLTGLAYVRVPDSHSDLDVIRTAELQFPELVHTVNDILQERSGHDIVVVIEKYTITMHTVKLSAQPDALYTIGAVRALLVLHGIDPASLVLQMPSAAKNIATNAMIKDMGLWHRGGKGHAQDASRHVLLYLLTNKWRPASILDSAS